VKSIRTTTVALVGAALLTLGALAGCSSDSKDKNKTTDTPAAAADSTAGSDSTAGDSGSGSSSTDAANFDIDCSEYTSVFTTVDPPTNPGDMNAMADYYDALAAKASGGMKNVLETMADAIRNPGDAAVAQRAADAAQAWSNAAMDCLAH